MEVSAPRVAALAPFQVRSFRFQWPADLATSWAFEMETLILGWYVLVETHSVLLLTIFASLQHLGTLISPMVGVMGDRIGHRNLLCAMRAIYAACAMTLLIFILSGVLTPVHVLVIAAIMGLVRPSDIGMRAALVGESMPPDRLLGAMSVQRTTQDSARIAGALSGAGLVAVLGMGPAYAMVGSLYVVSILLTLKAGSSRPVQAAKATAPVSAWRDLKEGALYIWNTPHLRAVMGFAFVLNLTAFPLYNGLQPYVAREIYGTDQTGLGYMVAGAALGALLGSILLSRFGHVVRPARTMIVFCAVWYTALLAYSHTTHPALGVPILIAAGIAQSLGMVTMGTLLLRTSDPKYRGRMMGIRMLAVYGNMPGLLLAGPLIASFGYPLTATFYCVLGLLFTLFVAVRWSLYLWRKDALANTR